ncbi:unnamed protein product, partial [Phaeothamnion confervicola]
ETQAWYASDCAGSGGNYTLSFNATKSNSNDLNSLVDGQMLTFRANGSSASSSTIKVNSLAPISLTKPGGAVLGTTDISNGQMVTVIYNQTQSRFELVG